MRMKRLERLARQIFCQVPRYDVTTSFSALRGYCLQAVTQTNDTELRQQAEEANKHGFQELPSAAKLLVQHPKILVKTASEQVKAGYVLDADVANEIAVKFIDGDTEMPILENEPGPGVLTRALLAHGAKKVYALQWNRCFLPYLKDLEERVPDRLKVMVVRPFLGSHTHYKGFKFIPKKRQSWEEDPRIKYCAVIPSHSSFSQRIIDAVAHKTTLFTNGRASMYIFTTARYVPVLIGECNCWSYPIRIQRSILCKTFFDSEVIYKVPPNSFHPQKIKMAKTADKNYYLVKMVPKRDLHKVIQPDLLPAFVSFVQYILEGNKHNVIKRMEQISQGCGLELIRKGFTVTQKVVALTHEQILVLFNVCVKRHDFESSLIQDRLKKEFEKLPESGPIDNESGQADVTGS